MEVDQVTDEGLHASTRKWVPDLMTPSRTIDEVRQQFLGERIRPVPGGVILEVEFAEMLGLDPGVLPVWFVTRAAKQRIFFDEALRQFGVALATDAGVDRFVDLGIRTPDPIDAFLA